MLSRNKGKTNRRSKYAAQFDALRDSIEGDPSQEQIAELEAIIRDENMERNEERCEWKPGGFPRVYTINFGECCE